MYIPLKTIKFIVSEFEKELNGFSIVEHCINDFEKILVIEDTLVLYIKIKESEMPVCDNAYKLYKDKVNEYFEIPNPNNKYYCLDIEELTDNSISFKFIKTKFIDKIKKITNIDYIYFNYFKYVGIYRQNWYCKDASHKKIPTNILRINKLLPSLNLIERCNDCRKFHYYIVAIEILTENNQLGVGLFCTNTKPHQYIVKKCNDWIKHGFTYGNMNMIYRVNNKAKNDIITIKYPYHIESALQSWQGKGYKRKYILENYLKYFYVEKYFDNKDDVFAYTIEKFKDICLMSINGIEKYSYTRPSNRWVTEELVYKICKKLFKNKYNVIYQHRPFYLKSNIGGQMSYDIFITGLNIAIEYQGKQHFEPIDFFGGQKAFENTIQRDKLKKELSIQNNVHLIYINYWEDINEDLIKNKLAPIFQ